MKREFGARGARRPAEACLLVFAEPLIERDLLKCRIKRAALAGRLGREGGAEKQEYETADHPTFYSTCVPISWEISFNSTHRQTVTHSAAWPRDLRLCL